MKQVPFSFDNVKENINKILNEHNDYTHLNHLPDVNNDQLSYTNGAYVDTTVFFIDIRNSSKLTRYYSRIVIARYYRAYINLILMVLRSHNSFEEDNISLLLKALNVIFLHKYGKRVEIKAGIGIEQGNILVFKVGIKGYKGT